MMNPKFIHLCTKSDYSIINGLSKSKELVNYAKILNMPALGILDYGNFYGVIKFYKYAIEHGIKPIFGIKCNIRFKFIIDRMCSVNILAKDEIGYKNLLILISKSNTLESKNSLNNHDLVIPQDLLIQYSSGLIILSAGYQGDMGIYILNNSYSTIEKFLNFYRKYFDHSYYFEIHRTNRIHEEQYIQGVITLSKKYHIPIVASNDVYFINKNDFYIHRIKLSICQGLSLNNNKNFLSYSCEQYMKSEKEMCLLFKDLPEALQNSVEIAKRCNVNISTGHYFLPSFPTGNINEREYLIRESIKGLHFRLHKKFLLKKNRKLIFRQYKSRLLMELSVINQMNFPGYFLIVMEFIKWSKRNNIPVGPGRGSGAGSLVAYVLQITEIDPISFDLIFERFLNPQRTSMPDFDIDFCMDKRDLVIDHVTNFYGKDKVSQIITFGTMSARAVIRDVGRVLGYPYGFVNNISKLIPLDPGMTLKQALSNKFSLVNLYNQDVEVKKIIDISKKLEGVIRNTGKHAGGIVIAPKSLFHFTPIQLDENISVTQFDKNDIDYVGLLKFDFLGLRTLTVIDHTINMINKLLRKKNKKLLDINQIPLDDKNSFNLLKMGQTIAIFQLESHGMRDLILKLKPDCFEDIISLIALFRPGPLQSGMVDNFINRKHGRELISYPDPKWQHISLKPILKSTYGIILYQEQVIKIAQILSGYQISKADILQRAMSKKNSIEMSKQRYDFNESSVKNGISYELSNKIFDLLEKFSGYGFNKSHSAAYALISYQTLWLKANYSAEFIASVMNSDIDNTDKIKNLIKECIRINIKIIPPNINISEYYFIVNDDKNIVYGLGAIKGIGKSIINMIMKVREKNIKFNDLFDFCIQVDSKLINKRVLEKLIFSGSFDVFNIKRCKLIQMVSKSIQLSHQYSNSKNISQLTLLKPIKFENKILDDKLYLNDYEWSNKQKLDYEKDVLGFYLTGSPLEDYINELKNYSYNIYNNYIIKFNKYKKKRFQVIFGIISSIRYKLTKFKKSIIFLELMHDSNLFEVIIFDNLINLYKDILKKDNIIIVTCYKFINNLNKRLKFIAHSIIEFNTARNQYIKNLILLITDKVFNENILHSIKKIIYPSLGGRIPIYICYRTKKINSNFKLHDRWNIYINDNIIYQLKYLLGKKSVYLKY